MFFEIPAAAKVSDNFEFTLKLNGSGVFEGAAQKIWARSGAQSTGIGAQFVPGKTGNDKTLFQFLYDNLAELAADDFLDVNIHIIQPTTPVQALKQTLLTSLRPVVIQSLDEPRRLGVFQWENLVKLSLTGATSTQTAADLANWIHMPFSPDCRIDQLGPALVQNKIDYLPICDGDSLIGIVNARDILPYWFELQEVYGSLYRDLSQTLQTMQQQIKLMKAMGEEAFILQEGLKRFSDFGGLEKMVQNCELLDTMLQNKLVDPSQN